LSGIAAILRFPIPDIEDEGVAPDDEEEEKEEEEEDVKAAVRDGVLIW